LNTSNFLLFIDTNWTVHDNMPTVFQSNIQTSYSYFTFTSHNQWNRDISQSVQRLGYGLDDQGSIPGSGKELFAPL
jgi:hypothetical protein